MISDKIKTLKELVGILSRLKNEGRKVVFTNGCFDLLHVGHVTYLENAKKLGDILVVAVNSDASVRRLKGEGRPVTKQNDRMKILAALDSVDFVVLFEEDTPAVIVEKLNPDIIVKGGDWREDEVVGGEYVKKKGGRVVTVPFCKGYSSSFIIKKIKETDETKRSTQDIGC